jgi:hypothetical protein
MTRTKSVSDDRMCKNKVKKTAVTEPSRRDPVTYKRYEEEELYISSEISIEEWLRIGTEKYGTDTLFWKFKCPACGHVSSGQDFVNVGSDVDSAYKMCIGRVTGKGVDGLKERDRGNGCNWSSGGLFKTLGRGAVVFTPDGNKIHVFPFAD